MVWTKDETFIYFRLVAVVATVTKPNINERSTSTKDQSFIYSKLVAVVATVTKPNLMFGFVTAATTATILE